MGGTSERKPPERDRAPRHLHAVPRPDQDKETGAAVPEPGSGAGDTAAPGTGGTAAPAPGGATVPGAGAGAASAAGPEPFPAPPPGTAGDGNAPPPARSAAGQPQAANGTSPPASGQPDTPSGSLGRPSVFWTASRGDVLAATVRYLVLLVFGLLLGLTGSFQYSRSVGPVPVGAVFFVLLIGATCWFCGRAARSVSGALVPSVGWIVASFSMAMPNTSGSVVITNSIAGEIYLYGGALCAAIGVGAAFGGWTRAQQAGGSVAGGGTRRPRP